MCVLAKVHAARCAPAKLPPRTMIQSESVFGEKLLASDDHDEIAERVAHADQ
jgi:hypothetical protein